jgi:spectrin beta
VRDLQLFNREADQIDASTSASAKFLENIAVGENFEDVEAFMKRHDDFTATLAAQEERANALCETAGRLVAAGHADSAAIAEKRDRVLAARAVLKEQAAGKRELLEESKVFQVPLAFFIHNLAETKVKFNV